MRLAVFLVCSGVGYLLGHYLPDPWATYVSILVSYHLFLFYLVITAEHDAGFAMPVLQTIVAHAACLAVLIGLAIGRRYVPFLGIVRLFVPALAPFEANWLFSKGAPRRAAPPEETGNTAAVAASTAASPNESANASETPSSTEAPATSVAPAAPKEEYTADDHTAWLTYLAQPRRAFRKPGMSVGDEMKLWLAARPLGKAAASQNQKPN